MKVVMQKTKKPILFENRLCTYLNCSERPPFTPTLSRKERGVKKEFKDALIYQK
jgi:hypothetical protein